MNIELKKKLYTGYAFLFIVAISLGCKNHDKNVEINNPPGILKVENINPEIKDSILSNSAAALPFCMDSASIPEFRKRMCSLKYLSDELKRMNPEWQSNQGVVDLSIIIEADGTVSEVKLSEDKSGKNTGQAVAEKCFEYLRNRKCIPARKNGILVRSRTIIPVFPGPIQSHR
jgi:hypothetical protein